MYSGVNAEDPRSPSLGRNRDCKGAHGHFDSASLTSLSVISFSSHDSLISPGTVLESMANLINGSVKSWALGQKLSLLPKAQFSERGRDGEGRKPGGHLGFHGVSSKHNKRRIIFSYPKFLRVLRRPKFGLPKTLTSIYHLGYLYLK